MYNNIYMIVAATEKTRAIGIDGQMLYHLPEDLKFFKDTTDGHTIVCGRRTYHTFNKKPLPNRKNIVLTRSNEKFENAYTMYSKEEVLDYAKNHPKELIFIVGGDNVYSQFINHAKRLYVTEIEENSPVKANSFFPRFDKNDYTIISESESYKNEDNISYKYVVYEKK